MSEGCATGRRARLRALARRLAGPGAALALVASAPGAALAADADPPAGPSEPVELERLLKLPEGFGDDVEIRQGATMLEWRSRFEAARKELETAREDLAQAEKELDSASEESSSWQVSAPGAPNAETSPLSIRLRNEVKALRKEINDATRRLRALDVEADLANVPQEWRASETE